MFFDALAHPTLNGRWLDGRKGETFLQLYDNAKDNNIVKVVCCGLPGVGAYAHESFFSEATKFGNFFFPVAALTEKDRADIEGSIAKISKIGFRAIKIHPRLLNQQIDRKWLSMVIQLSHENKLVVFLCTYYHCKCAQMPIADPFWEIVGAISDNPTAKIILVHGGGVHLLQYCELVRFNDNILLDLSLTFMKYNLSSIDMDIDFIFKNFDRRVCIGSDHPEWSYAAVNEKIKKITYNLSLCKRDNILKNNLMSFLKLYS